MINTCLFKGTNHVTNGSDWLHHACDLATSYNNTWYNDVYLYHNTVCISVPNAMQFTPSILPVHTKHMGCCNSTYHVMMGTHNVLAHSSFSWLTIHMGCKHNITFIIKITHNAALGPIPMHTIEYYLLLFICVFVYIYMCV